MCWDKVRFLNGNVKKKTQLVSRQAYILVQAKLITIYMSACINNVILQSPPKELQYLLSVYVDHWHNQHSWKDNILLKAWENYPGNRATFLVLIFLGRSKETVLTGWENNSADEDKKLVELQCFCANILLFFLLVSITGHVI